MELFLILQLLEWNAGFAEPGSILFHHLEHLTSPKGEPNPISKVYHINFYSRWSLERNILGQYIPGFVVSRFVGLYALEFIVLGMCVL